MTLQQLDDIVASRFLEPWTMYAAYMLQIDQMIDDAADVKRIRLVRAGHLHIADVLE